MRSRWIPAIAGLLVVTGQMTVDRARSPVMEVAGHGATCSDGFDNDGDGRADGQDIDDCLDAPSPGRQPDHHEDHNADRNRRPRGPAQPT